MPSSLGTDNLRSPEATQLKRTCPKNSADIWSLACTILYIFSQEWPFEDMTSAQIGNALQAGQMPTIPDILPLDLRCILLQCFTWPCTRSTAALMALKLQAMIEDTSVYQTSDRTWATPFPATASSQKPNPTLMPGRSAGRQVAAFARLMLQLQSPTYHK